MARPAMPESEFIGKRNGRLVCIREASRKSKNVRRFLFRCDCGKEKEIILGSFRSGRVNSCGCISVENIRAVTAKMARHLGAKTEYRTWAAMRSRCADPNNQSYALYGERGITVCNRWNDSFAHFLEDMGLRPSAKHSLDRIDNDGPYSPENCRWTTHDVQMRNQRRSRLITAKGRTLNICDWAKELGCTNTVLHSRIKAGWSDVDAVTVPVRHRLPNNTSTRIRRASQPALR